MWFTGKHRTIPSSDRRRPDVSDANVVVLSTAQNGEAQQLRFHCFCGDELCWRDNSWSMPLGPLVDETRHHTHRLAFRYRRDDGEWMVEIGRYPAETVDEVLEIMRLLPLSVGDRRWRALVSRLGPVPALEEVHKKIITLSGREIIAARRDVHPSHIVDRLMMRDRATAMTEIEMLLFGCRPQLESLLSA
jgi:hypothetical protein